MLERPLPESLLALAAGRARAAAIYGDLVELASTRGGWWFAAAYLRTLVTLTWRIVLALSVAVVGRQAIFDAFHVYLRHSPAGWRSAAGSWLDLLNSVGPLLACIMSTLWFVLPFAAVRYGLGDRLVRLTFAVALGTTVAFLGIPWVSLLAAAATLAVGVAALVSARWRRPAEALLAVGCAGVALTAASSVFQVAVRHAAAQLPRGVWPVLAGSAILSLQGSLLLLAVVCSRLHGWLVGRRSPVA